MMNLADFRHFFEDKDRFIDKLDLTDEQKSKVKAFFKVHPNYENKVDWNNKNLTWEDFQKVLELEGTSKNSKKKYGLSGKAQIEDLEEGKDYLIITETPDYTIYYPLNFKTSEVLAKPTTPPEGVTGQWCIAGRNYSPGTRDQHWNNYTEDGSHDFFFIFTKDTKYALSRDSDYPRESFLFNCTDEEVASFRCDDIEYRRPEVFSLTQMIDFPELISKTPDLLFEKQTFRNEDGCLYNAEKTQLLRIPKDIKDLKILDGTKEIKEQPDNYSRADYLKNNGVLPTFPNLRSVWIPDSVNSLPIDFLADCQNVNIRVGKNVTKIRCDAFRNCSGHISFAEGMTYLPKEALFGSKFSSVSLPTTLRQIGPGAFYSCTELHEITLPDGLEEIGSEAFQNTGLKELRIPDSVKFIGDLAIGRNSQLIFVKLPENLTVISMGLLASNPLLKTIEVPPKVQIIRDVAFTGCPSLKRLYLPKSLTFIDAGVFGPDNDRNPCSVKQVFFSGTREQWDNLMNPKRSVWWDSYAPVSTRQRTAQTVLADKVIFTDDNWNPIGE